MSSKVFVGLSGGVDSSVAAYLLKKEGYDVVGVFIKTWHPDWLPCTWKEERRSAMRVAAVLDIPLVTLDLEKEYKEGVVEYMIREYKAGRTPNPDVMCNKEVKFGAFYTWARSKGAEYIATGHYARSKNGRLRKGVDEQKDQSYFLWTLDAETLKHTLFPVGKYTKAQVRALAQEAGLSTAEKKDSQGICFLGDVDIKSFLSRYTDLKQGKVLSELGEEIGVHDGAIIYTLGQRHGFTITKKGDEEVPLYVVGKDIEKNTIVVSASANSKIQGVVGMTNQVWNTDVEQSTTLMCRSRYRQPLFACQLLGSGEVDVSTAIEPLAPGQSLVFYEGDYCLGGGVIA